MFPFYNITRSSSLPKLHLVFRTDCQNSRSYYCAYFMSVPRLLLLLICLSISDRLPAWVDGHFCGFVSAYATLLETAESTWRHVKYSLVAERSRVQRTRRDSLLWGNIQPKKPDSSTWSYCNPGLVGSRSVNVSNLANGNTPLSRSISITVTLLSWSSPAQHEPEDKRGWIGKSSETLVSHLNVCLCVCLCTFCSSVTYWATMKADSVVKLSAVAAIWEYILSINLEHWRYTTLLGP